MRIARDSEHQQRRTELRLNALPENVRAYIFELELEVERLQTRNGRLRKNIRSMQPKLQVENLKGTLASAAITHVHHNTLTESDVVRIVKSLEAASSQARRAVG